MAIGIIDADLLGRKKHRFPNLVCEKLSGYWQEQGEEVHLLMDYDHLDEYESVMQSAKEQVARLLGMEKEISDWNEVREQLKDSKRFEKYYLKIVDEVENPSAFCIPMCARCSLIIREIAE